MSQRILVSYSQVVFVYKWVTILAPSLFMICYIASLAAQARPSTDDADTGTLPLWLDFLYPSWLDRLTLGGILRAFVQALGMTVLLFLIIAAVLLVLAGKLLAR